MEDLLQGLMGGSEPESGAQGAGSDVDPTVQLLQSLLGGGATQDFGTQASSAPVQDEMGLTSLLQGVLGATGGLGSSEAQTQPAGAGGLGDMLGSILGGGNSGLQSNSILGPIVDGLAEKIGVSPQIAQAVVAFVLGKLVENRLQPGTAATSAPVESRAAGPQGASLEDVVKRMNSGKKVKKTQIRNAGMAEELAAYTGLDRRTAEASLKEVLNALGGQVSAGK